VSFLITSLKLGQPFPWVEHVTVTIDSITLFTIEARKIGYADKIEVNVWIPMEEILIEDGCLVVTTRCTPSL